MDVGERMLVLRALWILHVRGGRGWVARRKVNVCSCAKYRLGEWLYVRLNDMYYVVMWVKAVELKMLTCVLEGTAVLLYDGATR